MNSERKFWLILLVAIVLFFSLSPYANTFLIKSDKVKDKNGTEYLIFKDENKIQLGLNLFTVKDVKTGSIKRELKKKEESEQKEKEKAEKERLTKSIDRFSSNMLKLCMTIMCILLTFGVVVFLCVLSWFFIFIWAEYKKR